MKTPSNLMLKYSIVVYLFFVSLNLFSQENLPKSEGEIIPHKYYTLSYIESHEQANWVHYKLDANFFKWSYTKKRFF